MVVYVLDFEGNPLMPTRRFGKVRRMLESGQAVAVNYEPFTIRLTYCTTNYTQPVTLGVDAGSIHVGMSATTTIREVYASEINLRSKDIKKLLEKRRESRRTRRNRLRHRQARFDNRVSAKKKGWLAPSMQHRIDSHIRLIESVCKILPVTKIVVELGQFDTHAISNPDIEGEAYQHGIMEGFDNVKAFVRFRDKYKCRQCNGKSGDTRLEVHHIQHREDGGSDRPNNLVTLCHECHHKHHTEGMKLKRFSGLDKKNAVTLRDAAAMNIIKDGVFKKLKELYPDLIIWRTYGFVTRKNRRLNNIEKSHANDAYVISMNFSAEPMKDYLLGKQIRRHNRKIHKAKIYKGGVLKRNQAEHMVFGFGYMDGVRFNGTECFVFGRRTKGNFCLKDIDGQPIDKSANYHKIKLLCHERRIIYKRVQK